MTMRHVNVSPSSVLCLCQFDLLGNLSAENESKRMEPQLAPKRLYLAVQCLKRWGLMAEIAVLGTTEFGFTP
jgi:hypothetical protein